MELLDDVKAQVVRKPIFSITAIVLFLVFISSLYYIGKQIAPNGDNALYEDYFFIFIGISIVFFAGLFSCIVSLVRKEKPTFLKITGVVFYGLLIGAIILSFLL